VTGMGSNKNSPWSYDSLTKALDEMAALSAAVFAKVGKPPHPHKEEDLGWRRMHRMAKTI